MAPAFGSGMMDATTTTVQKKPGQKRDFQPEIDPSIPLHPWASTSKLHQQQHQQQSVPASASSSCRPMIKSQPPPQPQPQPQVQPQSQPQYAMSMHPPSTFPVAVAPIPTTSFYAQPQPQPLHANAAYARATPVPTAKPEPQYVPALPKKNMPTRADLDFLLGGSSRARAKSSTPSVADQQAQPRSPAANAPKVAPVAKKRRPHPHPPIAQTDVAGPSRVSASGPEASASSSRLRLSLKRSGTITERHDDDLPLGAEAVMESDHEARSSFEADNEAEGHAHEKDDPNDRDFRPTKKRISRVSRTSKGAATAAADGAAPKKRARRSLASTSTTAGKVAGSPGEWLTPDGPKRRGRPPKEAYTPDVLEQIKAAEEMLGFDSEHQEELCRKRLSEIIDPQTMQALSPEMRTVLLRTRNTQLQRERLKRLREAGILGAKSKSKLKQDAGEVGKEEKPKRRARRRKEVEEAETGSGSAILEKAKGKVTEWIKSISSEAETSGDAKWDPNDEMADAASPKQRSRLASSVASSSKQRQDGVSTPPPPPSAPAAQKMAVGGDGNIDPRLFADINPADDELVQGYFSRFATVTGDSKPDSSAEGQTFQAGVVGDEYYFSN